jgi:hypothetical protein
MPLMEGFFYLKLHLLVEITETHGVRLNARRHEGRDARRASQMHGVRPNAHAVRLRMEYPSAP